MKFVASTIIALFLAMLFEHILGVLSVKYGFGCTRNSLGLIVINPHCANWSMINTASFIISIPVFYLVVRKLLGTFWK